MRRLPALLAGGVPVLFIPICVDSFILPRVSLLLIGTGLGFAGTLWTGFPGRRLGALRWPAVAVCAAALTAGVVSVLPSVSVAGLYTRYESWPVRIAYVLAFGCSVWLLRSPLDVARVGSWFSLGVAACAAQAVVQAVVQTGFGLVARPDGNLGQPGLLGVLCAMALPVALWRARAGWRWLPIVGLIGAGLVASTARSAWVAAGFGLLISALLIWPRRWQRPALVGSALLAALVTLLLLSPLRSLNSDTGSGRVHVWADSLRLIAARPLAGWGEDTTGQVLGRFLTGDWEPGDYFDRVHSQPLDLLATQGVIGLACCAFFFALLWAAVIRARRALPGEVAAAVGACGAYAAWSLVNFDWAPATAGFWVLGGCVWWSVAAPAAQAPAAGRVPTAARRVLAVAILAAGLVAGVAPVAADIAYHAGRPQLAQRLDPLQAQYRLP